MIFFSGKTLNSVYFDALKLSLDEQFIPTSSRCGAVRDLGVACFEFIEPDHQLLLLKGRKYNPFFSLIESCWVLGGCNKLSVLQSVLSDYDKFSDDGLTLHGAYGHRMRAHFGFDQIEECISVLKSDPNSRRATIDLHEPADLLARNSLDIPCNTAVYLKVRNGRLDLTVVNRSNDLFLGVPYNVFVFGILHKYIAHRLSINIGRQCHFTDSLHLYEKDVAAVEKILLRNDQGEIDRLQSSKLLNENFFCDLFLWFEQIYNFDIQSLGSIYFRDLLSAYLKFKKDGSRDLIDNLPDDTFGCSARLWADSLSKNGD